MPAEMYIGIELLNHGPVIARLEGIEHRVLHHPEAFDEVMGVLEDSEVRIFEAWGGRYVDTGDLRDSLTLPDADGAIREVEPNGALFGSAVPYSIYQREHGHSAVMRFDEADYAEVSAIVLRYIVEGIV